MREAQDSHNLTGWDNVESGLPGNAIDGAAQADNDIAKKPVIHVHDATPRDLSGVNIHGIAMIDTIVQQGGKQVVGTFHGREIIGKVKVDIIDRMDSGKTSTGGAAFHAKNWSERWLAQSGNR